MKVALLDPGSDGLSLAAALRSAGFDVELAALSSITSLVADVLEIAGDAPGALASLRAMRDDGMRPDTPVVLVGAPQGMPLLAPGPAFGADWALSREAAEHDLAHAVRSVAARSSARSEVAGLREHTFDLGEDARSQVNARVDPRELDRGPKRDDGADAHGREPGREPGREHREEHGEERSGEREPPSGEIEVPARKKRSSDPAPRQDFADAGSVEIAFDAPVSPALAELLLAADRRVFPHLPPTDPSLPRGESSARELVPESLFLFTASEPEEEPALDSLTFVGAVPEVRPEALPRTSPGIAAAPSLVSGMGGARPSTPASLPHPGPDALTPAPRRLSERPRVSGLFHPALEPTPTRAPTEPKESLGRDAPPREPLQEGVGNVLVWIRALRERVVSGVSLLSLEAPNGGRAILTLEDGHVVGLVAHVAGAVLSALDGRPLDERPLQRAASESDEADAERELERRMQGGLLSAHRLERLRSEARRDLLTGLIGAESVRFRIEPTRVTDSTRPFSRRFLPLLVELAARVIDAPRALSLLVPGVPSPARARVTRTGAFTLFARATELSPEIDVLLGETASRGADRRDTLGALLAAGWEEPALPACLVVLAGLGAVEIDAASLRESSREDASSGGHDLGGADPSRAHAVKAWLDEVSHRAEEGDYFAILEVPRDASTSDVVRAYGSLSARLTRLHLPSLELASLEPKRRAALETAHEAHRVLTVEHWRKAYREALER